ncbi:MAG TPA: hypothetical protein VFY06_07555 [Verrucomicrobiae bacterium]|nr:hypothetical protein [Verrucomicrobiae bacterium]
MPMMPSPTHAGQGGTVVKRIALDIGGAAWNRYAVEVAAKNSVPPRLEKRFRWVGSASQSAATVQIGNYLLESGCRVVMIGKLFP